VSGRSTVASNVSALSTRGLVARGALGAFAVKVAAAGIGLGIEVLLARALGVNQFGIFAYVWAWLTVLALVAKFGWDTALVRFVPVYTTGERPGLLAGLLRYADRFVLLTSVGMAVAVVAAVTVARNHLSAGLWSTFIIGAVALPFISLTELCRGALQGLKRVVRGYVPGSVIRPVFLGLLVGALLLAGDGQVSAGTAMACNVLAVAIAFGVGLRWRGQALPAELSNHSPRYEYRQWLSVAAPLLVIAGMNVIMGQSDIIIVGYLKSARSAGIYTTATKISGLVAFGLSAANTVVAPLIAELYEAGRREELQRMVRFATRGILVFTLPVAIALALLGKIALAMFGAAFVTGYSALLLLLAAQAVNALSGPVGYLMIMTRYQGTAAAILSIAAIVNIGLNVVLVPRFGLQGAAAASLVTTAAWNVCMFFFVLKRTGIRSAAV
jgi:O-antigen/teichoic acid export membrane protein